MDPRRVIAFVDAMRRRKTGTDMTAEIMMYWTWMETVHQRKVVAFRTEEREPYEEPLVNNMDAYLLPVDYKWQDLYKIVEREIRMCVDTFPDWGNDNETTYKIDETTGDIVEYPMDGSPDTVGNLRVYTHRLINTEWLEHFLQYNFHLIMDIYDIGYVI